MRRQTAGYNSLSVFVRVTLDALLPGMLKRFWASKLLGMRVVPVFQLVLRTSLRNRDPLRPLEGSKEGRPPLGHALIGETIWLGPATT